MLRIQRHMQPSSVLCERIFSQVWEVGLLSLTRVGQVGWSTVPGVNTMCQWNIVEGLLRLRVRRSVRKSILEEVTAKKNLSLKGSIKVGQNRRPEISGRKNTNEGAELKTSDSFHGEPFACCVHTALTTAPSITYLHVTYPLRFMMMTCPILNPTHSAKLKQNKLIRAQRGLYENSNNQRSQGSSLPKLFSIIEDQRNAFIIISIHW